MAKLYWMSVKKWLKKAGIPVGVLGVMAFLFLSMSGAITITGHSGDMECAGTEDDPCYAYLNFTANEDVFIYKTDYDPYGRNVSLVDFGSEVKDWKMQRSWGSGWRDINLQEGCTGTWCGCHWCRANETSEYAYAFRENKSYQIRIVAYKKNAFEDVKWSFGLENLESKITGESESYLDPTWYGVEDKKINYTPTSKTICNNGKCTKTLYSGTRFVEEDNIWKKVEEAKSLKGKGFFVDYLEKDPNFNITVNDFNSSYINMSLNFEGNPEDYPESCQVKDSLNAKCNFKLNEKWIDYNKTTKEEIEKNQLKFQYKWKMKEGEKIKGDKVKFKYKGNPFNNSFKFGGNSTTIKLQDANTENLDDVAVGDDSKEDSTDDHFRIKEGSEYNRGYLRFNISSLELEPDEEIKNSTLFVYKYGGYREELVSDVENYHVYQNNWTEENISSSNQPCGDGVFPSGSGCNTINEDSYDAGETDDIWYDFEITEMLKNNFNNNLNKLSVVLWYSSDSSSYSNRVHFRSKEHSTVSERPYLNITYGDKPLHLLNITNPTQNNPKTVSSGDNISINFDYFVDGVEQTSGVDYEKTLIDGDVAEIIGETYAFINDFESFESDFGNWSNEGSNDEDWQRNSGGTDSSGTGPSDAYDGDYYIYVETSSGHAYDSGDTSIVEYDYGETSDGYVDFYYHQDGSDQGTIYLEGYDGSSWNEIWSSTGDQGDQWNHVGESETEFSGYSSLRFRNVAAGSYNGDIALDAIDVVGKTEFSYISGEGWEANVTVPDKAEGTYDLFANATYDEYTENSTEKDAITYEEEVTDTCSCPGTDTNWEIDMSDYCNITSDCDIGTGNISFVGEGTTNFNSTIYAQNMEDPSTDQKLNIGNQCSLYLG